MKPTRAEFELACNGSPELLRRYIHGASATKEMNDG